MEEGPPRSITREARIWSPMALSQAISSSGAYSTATRVEGSAANAACTMAAARVMCAGSTCTKIFSPPAKPSSEAFEVSTISRVGLSSESQSSEPHDTNRALFPPANDSSISRAPSRVTPHPIEGAGSPPAALHTSGPGGVCGGEGALALAVPNSTPMLSLAPPPPRSHMAISRCALGKLAWASSQLSALMPYFDRSTWRTIDPVMSEEYAGGIAFAIRAKAMWPGSNPIARAFSSAVLRLGALPITGYMFPWQHGLRIRLPKASSLAYLARAPRQHLARSFAPPAASERLGSRVKPPPASKSLGLSVSRPKS